MLSRASMQATTATPFAGGNGRSPLSNASAYLWLLVSSSSVTLMLHSLLPETPPLLEQLMMAPSMARRILARACAHRRGRTITTRPANPYSPRCREGLFSKRRRPTTGFLGNSVSGIRRAGAVRPRLQDSESTSYCCRLCSICSVPCRSWSCLASQSCSGVTFVLTIPQKGMTSSNASSSLGESDSTINATALSPTGKPPARIFPSDLKVFRASCPGRTTYLIIPTYCSVGSRGPGSTKSMVTRYCIPPSSFLSRFPRGVVTTQRYCGVKRSAAHDPDLLFFAFWTGCWARKPESSPPLYLGN